MDLIYGPLTILGDGELVNFKELSLDRDFILKTDCSVLNLHMNQRVLQFPQVQRYLVRASLVREEASLFLLAGTDLASQVCALTFPANKEALVFSAKEGQCHLSFQPKEPSGQLK